MPWNNPGFANTPGNPPTVWNVGLEALPKDVSACIKSKKQDPKLKIKSVQVALKKEKDTQRNLIIPISLAFFPLGGWGASPPPFTN